MAPPGRYVTFWDRVSAHTRKEGDCLVFYGSRDDAGYGRIHMQGQKKLIRIHRAVYERMHGPIPIGMVIMHTCDNRACIALAHLQMGTQVENIQDMHRKQRAHRMPYSFDVVF